MCGIFANKKSITNILLSWTGTLELKQKVNSVVKLPYKCHWCAPKQEPSELMSGEQNIMWWYTGQLEVWLSKTKCIWSGLYEKTEMAGQIIAQ